MPYYRIVIWTSKRRQPYTGIRWIDNHNINSVFLMTQKKAEETFRRDLLDVEVQMLSKICTAVKKYIEAQDKKRQAKKKIDDSLSLDTPKVRPGDYRPWYDA